MACQVFLFKFGVNGYGLPKFFRRHLPETGSSIESSDSPYVAQSTFLDYKWT